MNYTVNNVYGKTHSNEITVSVPGSKSITARAMLLAALANGKSVLSGAQFSDDCATFLNCLKELGVEYSLCGGKLTIVGTGGKLTKNKATINVGSAGTAARFLPAFLAFQEGEYTLFCSEQMKSRPVAPLINTLKQLGARFKFSEKENSYPFTIYGTSNPADRVSVDIGESSQFLSALLISSTCAGKPLTIDVIGSHGSEYIDMTINMMRSFGVNAQPSHNAYTVSGNYVAQNYNIEPDVSAACYFYAMNKILKTNVKVSGVTSQSLQGDIRFIELLKTFNGGKVDMSAFSDQALTLAAIAPYLNSPTEICNVAHIRKQECNRIHAITYNLSAMGVRCEERESGVIIYPGAPRPAKINTFGDHRVAMSFALTGLRADGIVIEKAEVCSKTFKDYFNVLDGVCAELTK